MGNISLTNFKNSLGKKKIIIIKEEEEKKRRRL
jgi:hypothetical protein